MTLFQAVWRRRGAAQPCWVAPSPPEAIGKFAYIDALRGIAVVLVIFSHVGNAYHNLPWPMKALANFGFFGVQLFFVVSCFTLMHSWRSRAAGETSPTRNFFIRRVFRILPLYALAAAFYTSLYPPPKMHLDILVTSFLFVNWWSPYLLGTAANSWVVVPGGWSITVEFAFYMLFPWVAPKITSPGRAVVALAAALVLAQFADAAADAAYEVVYGKSATDQFLYYWLPNQLSIFALGFLSDQLVARIRGGRIAELIRAYRTLLLAGLLSLAALVAYLPTSPLLQPTPPYLPRHVLAGFIFVGLLCVLASGGRSQLVNKVTIVLGKVSFSAYLLHFAVISVLETALSDLVARDTAGAEAIFRCCIMMLCTTLLTAMVSGATYRWIEQPMIALGNRLCMSLDRKD